MSPCWRQTTYSCVSIDWEIAQIGFVIITLPTGIRTIHKKLTLLKKMFLRLEEAH